MDPLELDRMDGIAFITDRDGFIQAIGESNWDHFATANGAPELTEGAVVGRCLFDYISGRQVRDDLKKLMTKVSEDPNWSWVLPCSCDAPALKRHQRQYLRPVFSESECVGFFFHTIELSNRQRPPLRLFDFKRLQKIAKKDASLPVVLMCSWCQRVHYNPISGVSWIDAEDYYAAGGTSDVRLSHAICEDCSKNTDWRA